ncbi:MAG TPA: Gfo/Idh/MocA family oxidoreductase, partial [Planctomycetota bacterium]|nr:Gfo/Idh/MocA family oxidoreductase [Planctomycetota bacterium]
MSIPIGMIGGGQGAFIGAVHRIALAMDGRFRLVAGCFSRDPSNTAKTGAELGLDPARCYGTYQEMLEGELARPTEDRIAAVSIVTPNHVHREPTVAFLDAGFHVICDKPMATSLKDGRSMVEAARRSGRVFALTHNYTGYPMVREAREWVRSGKLGTVRKGMVEYLQGWLSEDLEATGQKQASWRTDPSQS